MDEFEKSLPVNEEKKETEGYSNQTKMDRSQDSPLRRALEQPPLKKFKVKQNIFIYQNFNLMF